LNIDITLQYFDIDLFQNSYVDSYASKTTNFGITDGYRYGLGFDGNCITGMNAIRLDGYQISEVYINMATYPIETTFSLVRTGAGYFFIKLNHTFICMLQYHNGQECV
jgi:hypothetical protein